MRNRSWRKLVLLALSSGTLFVFNYGACLQSTVQRTVVGIAVG